MFEKNIAFTLKGSTTTAERGIFGAMARSSRVSRFERT